MNNGKQLLAGTVSLLLLSGGHALAEESVLPPESCINPMPGFTVDLTYPWINRDAKPLDDNGVVWAAQYLSALKGNLNDKGVKLLPVFMPAPVIFKPKQLSEDGGANSDAVSAEYSRFLDTMQNYGVDTINLVSVAAKYKDQIAYHRLVDHHWTAEGAILAAYELSKLINPDTASDARDPVKEISELEFKTEKYLPTELANIISDKCNPNKYYISYKDYNFPDSKTSESSDSLFGDVGSSIAVFGTSYTYQSNYAFSRAIEYFTGRPTISYATRGGGAATEMQENIVKIAEKVDDTDTLVWELNNIDSAKIMGAASNALGLLHGACNEDDPLYQKITLSGRYGQKVSIPQFMGVYNTLNIYAPKDLKVFYDLHFTSKVDIHQEISLRQDAGESQPFSWDMYVPEMTNSDGSTLSFSGLDAIFTGNGEDQREGGYEFEAAMCLKF